MPLHDFRCSDCGTLRRDIYVPVDVGASHAEVYCPACDADLSRMIRMEPIPAFPGTVPLFGVNQRITIPVETPGGGYKDVVVDSLATIRKLEKDSEQAERNGEGRKMIWRDYSQDRSNTDVHTIAPDPSLTPAKTFVNGDPVIARKGDPVTADHGTVED